MSSSDRPKPPPSGRRPAGPDPDDPPSDEELRASAALRRALEVSLDSSGRAKPSDVAQGATEFARAIRAVAAPSALSAERHREILERALGADAAKGVPRERAAKSKVTYVVWGTAASLVAMAAAIALVIGAKESAPMSAVATADRARSGLALSRSTADLFPEGIPRSGGTTDRVDRIAYARAQDFRQNRFARWGTP